MKAWQIVDSGEPNKVLELTDKLIPVLNPGHIRFAVHAVALSLPDVLMCRGIYAFKPQLPFTPGQEFVGEVIECADDVSLFKLGDRVAGVSSFFTGDGAYAEQTVAMESSVYPVSESMSDEQAAAFIIAYHTAYVGLVLRAGLVAGETVLVHGGSGGVGSAAIQLAKALGARVIACAGGLEKVAVCKQLGADVVIDHQETSFVDAVKELTDGRGVNVIYDPVGGDTYEQSFACLASQGRMIPIGFASGRWGNTPLDSVVFNNFSVIGAIPAGFDRPVVLDYHNKLIELYDQGKITNLIDHTIGCDEVPQGLQEVADRKSVGRIVMLNG